MENCGRFVQKRSLIVFLQIVTLVFISTFPPRTAGLVKAIQEQSI